MELLACFLPLLALSMKGVGPTKRTELLKGKPIRRPPFVLGGRVVPTLALRTGQSDDVSHNLFQNFTVAQASGLWSL